MEMHLMKDALSNACQILFWNIMYDGKQHYITLQDKFM